jgi:hypothetical protein
LQTNNSFFLFQLVVAEPNRGVEYRYIYPLDRAPSLLPTPDSDAQPSQETATSDHKEDDPHRQRHGGKYTWTLKTLTVCSRSCGGGYQTTVAVCVRGPQAENNLKA